MTLFKPFPDPYRQSLTGYSDQLLRSFRAVLLPTEEVTAYLPRQPLLAPRVAPSWPQYGGYQLRAHFAQGDIKHVTEHSLRHLVYSLDARRMVGTFHDALVLKVANDLSAVRGFLKRRFGRCVTA